MSCSFLIQCNSCLEEKYRVEVFIANLFVLNGIPGDVIVSSATGGICDCWLLSYTQIGFIIIFTIIQPSLFITLISNSRTHSPVRLLVLSLFLLCISFYFFFVFVFLFFFINLFSFFFFKGQGEGEQVNQHRMEDNEEHGGEGGKNLLGVT